MPSSKDQSQSSLIPKGNLERLDSQQAGHVDMYQPGKPIGYLAARGTIYERKYFTRKLAACLLFFGLPIALIALVIISGPVLFAVANHIVNVSQVRLDIVHFNIAAQNRSSVPILLNGRITKTGIFPATAYFRSPIDLYWFTPPPNSKEVKLGTLKFAHLGITSSGYGTINQATDLYDIDGAALSLLATFIATNEEFTLKLNCSSVHLAAFNFIPAWNNIAISQHVIIKGLKGLNDVKLKYFDVPSDDPIDGAMFQAVGLVNNPSPIDLAIGNLSVNLYYQNMSLGQTNLTNFMLHTGFNTLPLQGRIFSHANSQHELAILSNLVESVVNNEDVSISVKISPKSDIPIWIQAAVDALHISVVWRLPSPLQLIEKATIGDLNATILSTDSYHPRLSSSDIQAQVRIPFGLSLSIVSVNVSLDIGHHSTSVMAAHLDGIQINASSLLDLVSPGVREGKAFIRLEESTLSPLGTDKKDTSAFDSLIADVLLSDTISLDVKGSAGAIIDSSLGRLSIGNIHLLFSTEPFLALSSFHSEPAKVLNFDVPEATTESFSVQATAQIQNPSLITVKINGIVGVSFFFQDKLLGTAHISDLLITPGSNDIQALADKVIIPDKSTSLINNYLASRPNTLQVIGNAEDTSIDLLKTILPLLKLTADLPGLNESLLISAKIEVLNSTDVGSNNILHAIPSVRNPFSSQITVSSANGTATVLGIEAARVDEAQIIPLLMIEGRNSTDRQAGVIEAAVNFAPNDIFGLVRGLLIEAGEDLRPLDYLLQIAGITPTQTIQENQHRSTIDKREFPFDNFNLPNYINAALQKAKAEVDVTVKAQIAGKYPISANLQQNDVPLLFDSSIEQLYSRVGKTIIDTIISRVVLEISSIDVTDLSIDLISINIQAQLTNIGPFDAIVNFPRGINILFGDELAGNIALPAITITPERTALNFQTTFAIASEGVMEKLVESIILKPSIELLVMTDLINIDAFGAQLFADSLKKIIQVSTFNSFKNSVSLDVFDLPDNNSQGGISITASANVQNPSQIGISLNRLILTFNLQTSPELGEVELANTLRLLPSQHTKASVAGRILPQSGQGLKAFQEIVQNYITNVPTNIVVNGISAGPEDAIWLNNAIRQLSLSVIVAGLPGFNPVKHVQLDVVDVDFTIPEASSWKPTLNSPNISAEIAIPFNFPFSIDEASGSFDILFDGNSAGQLQLSPTKASITGRTVLLSINGAHFDIEGRSTRNVFQNELVVQTLFDNSVHLGLNAKADAVVVTSAGTVSVHDVNIFLDDALNLAGFQGLTSSPINTSGLNVIGGTKRFALASINAAINNPSDIHAIVGDVSLDIFYNDGSIGIANVKKANIQIGNNVIHVDVQANLNSENGRQLIKAFLANEEEELIFHARGRSASTKFDSLNPALYKLDLSASIQPLKSQLITQATLKVPQTIREDLKVQAQFQFNNPFSTKIEIMNAKATAFNGETKLATVDTSINLDSPGHSTTESPLFDVQIEQNINALIGFFIQQASLSGVDIQVLLPLLELLRSASSLSSLITYSFETEYDPNANTFEGAYDVVAAIKRTLQGTLIRADAEADVKIGEYTVEDAQVLLPNINLSIDDSVRYLIGPFGAPIVEKIAKEIMIEILDIKVENFSQGGIDVQAEILLRNIGPFAAQISFSKPIDALYQNRKIAELDLPSFDLTSSGRISLRLRLNVVDQNAFGAFVADALQKDTVELEISSNSVQASAYGINFASIHVQRSIAIKAFDGLPGVSVSGVDVIGDTENTLLIAANASIPSRSSIEASLPSLTFNFLYNNQVLGQADVGPSLLLKSNFTTSLEAKGFVSQIADDKQRDALGQVASFFISNHTFSVDVVGKSAKDLNGNQITWLTNALETIRLTVEVRGKDLFFVKSVELADLTAVIPSSEAAYDFPLSTNVTSVDYFVPFPIHVTPQMATGSVLVSQGKSGTEAATVELQGIPLRAKQILGGGETSQLTLSLNNTRIRALDRKELEGIITVAISQPTLNVYITGSVQAQVLLAVGQITVSNIRLDFPISFAAIDNVLSSVKVDGMPRVIGGNSDHAIAEVTVKLQNPSIITARIPSVRIPVFLDNVSIGAAIVNGLEIQPGECILNVSFLVKLEQPIGSPTAVKLVRQLIQPIPGTNDPYYTDLIAHGIPNAVPPLSPLQSINPGLETLHIGLSLEGIAVQLIQLVNIQIDILTLAAGPGGLPYVSANIDLLNDLPTDLALLSIVADASKTGSPKTYAKIDHDFNPSLILPAAVSTKVLPGRVNTGTINQILLPMGLLQSLDILGQPLDLNINKALVKIGGADGYELQGQLEYLKIPATYSLILGGLPLINITSITDFFDGILRSLGSLSTPQMNSIQSLLQNFTHDEVSNWKSTGLDRLICDFPLALPVPLVSQAGCPGSKTATTTTTSIIPPAISSSSSSNSLTQLSATETDQPLSSTATISDAV